MAEGICAQTLISKIENNEVMPNKKLLEKLSKKLNEDLVYIVDREKETISAEKIKK